jgi:hypothetical protein
LIFLKFKFFPFPDSPDHQWILDKNSRNGKKFSLSAFGVVPNGVIKTRLELSDNVDENIGTMTYFHECNRHNQTVKGDNF